MADGVRNLLLRITGDPSDARRALREVAAEVQAFARQDAEAHIRIGGEEDARAKLRSLENALTLIGQRDVTAHVRVEVDQGRARLAVLRRELEHALSGGAGARPLAHIVGDIEQVGEGIARLGVTGATGFARLGESAAEFGAALGRTVLGTLGAVGESMVRMVPVVGQIGGAFLTAAASGGGLAVALAALPITLGVMLAGFVALAPVVLFLASAMAGLVVAVGAVMASLAAAAAFVGGLALAFGAALIPVFALMIPVIARVTQMFQALREEETNASQSARQVADAQRGVQDAQRGVADAHRGVTDATRGLADAQSRLRDAATQAWRDYADAVERVDDDIRSVQHAQLGVEEARLNTQQARQDLRDWLNDVGRADRTLWERFRNVDFRPAQARALAAAAQQSQALSSGDRLTGQRLALRVRESVLGEADAHDTLGDAQRTQGRDQETVNEYRRRGIGANDGYRAALEGVEAAERGVQNSQRGVRDANRRLADSQRNVAEAIDDTRGKARELPAALRDMLPTLRRLWQGLKDTFNPAINEVIAGMVDGAESFIGALTSGGARDAVRDLGRSIGGVFRTLGRELGRPAWQRFFVDLARVAGRLAGVLGGDAFVSFARIMRNLARAFLPDVVEYARRFAGWLRRIAGSTEDADRLRRIVGRLRGHFEAWWGVARSLAGVVRAFFHDTDDVGKSIATSLRRILDRFARWLEQGGREEMRQWLSDAAELTRDIFNAAQWLAGAFKTAAHWASRIAHWLDVARDAATTVVGGGGRGAGRRTLGTLLRSLPTIGPLFSGMQHGGEILGFGADTIPLLGQRGEYLLRQNVVRQIGLPGLNMLNAGMLPAVAGASGGGRGGTHIGQVVLPPPPSGTMDARAAAVMFAREMERRGT